MLPNFGWIEPGRLAGMGRPRPGAARELRAERVAAVLVLTEDPPLPELLAEEFEVLHEPVRDFAAPSSDALGRCVAFARAQLDAGRGVVVHCHAGYGRTGTVLAAILVAQGREAEEAIALVRRLRPGSIETAAQAEVVRRFGAARKPPGEGR
jgi:protein-tyrosine phosphatase